MDTYLRAVADAGSFTPSASNINEIKATLLEQRLKAKKPETLQQLAIGCVVLNRMRFLQQALNFFLRFKNNPFENIPNGIVEKLILAVCSAEDINILQKQYMVLQLLNGNVSEFNFEEMDKLHCPDSASMFFRHMLENCPKIKKVDIKSGVWMEFNILPRLYQEDLLPIMASCWPNLTSLCLDTSNTIPKQFSFLKKVDSLETCKSVVQAICCSLPNLTDLDVTLKHDKFTMEDVNHLAQMKHLKRLVLHLTYGGYALEEINAAIDLSVHAAGRVPFLEFFCIKVAVQEFASYHNRFLKEYAKLYAAKDLTLEEHWLDLCQKGSWPACLKVNELHINGKSLLFDLKSLPIASLHKLSFHEVPFAHITSVLKNLGSNITDLCSVAPKNNENPMDLYTVFAACPKLQHVSVDAVGGIIKSCTYKLTIEHFKNISTFRIVTKNFAQVDAQISKVYKKFFLGCKTMAKTYYVDSACELRGMVWALQENTPTCLDELVQLEIKDVPPGVGNKDVFRAIGMLIQRSPFFEKVFIGKRAHDFRPALWFKQIFQALGCSIEEKTMNYLQSKSYSSEEDDDEEYSDYDVDGDDFDPYYGISYDSSGDVEFEDIQSYLLWKDSL